MRLRDILKSDDIPQSIHYEKKSNLFIFKNWETHNVFIDDVKEVEGGIVKINYTIVDEDNDPESRENLSLDSEIPSHVENSLRYLLKENFKIKPRILSYINTQLEYYLEGFDIDLRDIKSNLSNHIALERIDLLSENNGGFVKVSYVFSTSWHYHATSALEVLVLNNNPKNMAQSGMIWE